MKGKILLVDDSAYMRGILRKILVGAGYSDILEAQDGAAAIAVFERERPDLVLMDIIMPQKNGLEALREIRDRDRAARVVMVSAIGQEVIMEEAAQAGAAGFIVKPFRAEEVRDSVERFLGPGGAA